MKYKLIINLKTYEESTGKKAIEIAKICKELEKDANKRSVELIICPQLIDLRNVIDEKVKVFSQHIDDYNYGAHTGYTIPSVVKKAGSTGTLINHSEHRLKVSQIKKEINITKEIGLESCVCVRNSNETKKIAKIKPTYIAVEPKELIGGDVSISTAKPDLIKKSVENASETALLVGAGVKTKEDVKKSLELGAKGILVASGVVKAKNIKKEILSLIEGFE